MKISVFVGLLLACLIESSAWALGAKLSIGVKGRVGDLDVSALQAILPEEVMTVENPAYGNKKVTYRGVPFKDLLLKMGRNLNLDDYKIVVTCLDGYRPVLDAKIFLNGRALLAFQEDVLLDPTKKTADGLWTKVKMGNDEVSPGPFYLVWSNPTGTYPQGWPFQIAEILLVPLADFDDVNKLAPKGAFDAETVKGFHLFTENCLVCHSIRYTGPLGKAPDLAYVTDYRDDAYVTNIMTVGRGAMPPFSSVLSKAQMESVVKYLKNSAAQKP